MYQPKHFSKKNPVQFWSAPDRIFFASGACHILAHAFLERFRGARFRPVWIRPAPGFWGNHVLVTNGDIAFDYHGYDRAVARDQRRRVRDSAGHSGMCRRQGGMRREA